MASVYPEAKFSGFTRYDGTVAFYSRIQALDPTRILNVGCGTDASHCGNGYRSWIRDFPRAFVCGIDVDDEASANPFIDEFRLIHDATRWPAGDSEFNCIIADCVVEHVADPAAFFRQCARVLDPGGIIAIRTTNACGYPAIVSRLTPNRFHAAIVSFAQKTRKSKDVFPTLYRCNTRRKLSRILGTNGFDGAVFALEAEPQYLLFNRFLFRLAAYLHPLIPPAFRSTLLAFGRKIVD